MSYYTHTPTTEEVKWAWANPDNTMPYAIGDKERAFDRWLAGHDRELREHLAAERARGERVRALTGGPFSDGYRPYAVEVDGEVILAVGLDDLRAALADPEAGK
jgi:hypothetical protein